MRNLMIENLDVLEKRLDEKCIKKGFNIKRNLKLVRRKMSREGRNKQKHFDKQLGINKSDFLFFKQIFCSHFSHSSSKSPMFFK